MGIIKQVEGPPNQIEITFLSELLKNTEWFDICYQIDNVEKYITHTGVKKIVAYANEFYSKYNSIPTFDDLRTSSTLDISIVNYVNNTDIDVNIDEFKINVSRYFKLTNMINIINTDLANFNIHKLNEIDNNIDVMIDKIKEVQSFDLTYSSDFVDGAVSLDFMDEYLINIVNPDNIMPTGYSKLDEQLGGGFIKGTLNLFIAGTHVGKTLSKQNIAMNMAEAGRDVLYIPLEMSSEEMHRRLFARVLQSATVDINDVTWDNMRSSVEEWYANTVKGSIRFSAFAVGELTSNKLEGVLHKYHKQYGKYPDAVYVDSGNLMKTKKVGANSHDEGQDIANDLKGISQRYELAMVVSNQLNREGIQQSKARGEAAMDLVAGSIYWAQVADNVIILTVDPMNDAIMKLNINKNRNTGVRDVPITLRRNIIHQHIYDDAHIDIKIEKSTNNISMTHEDAANLLGVL